MTLEQAYFAGELVAALAVILSLLYLAVQVRQNTLAIRLGTLHDVKETIREVNLAWAEHADLAQIMFDGFQDLTKLDGVDRVRFYTTAHNLFLGYENIYFQYQDGALDPRHWKGIAQHMVDASKVAGLLTYWEERKHWFTDEFRDYWETRVLPAPANTSYRLMGT